jgi:hypothetical protein
LRQLTRILYRPPPQDCARYDILLRRLDHDWLKTHIFDTLKDAGQALGIKPFGLRR